MSLKEAVAGYKQYKTVKAPKDKVNADRNALMDKLMT